jgi:hypothetical protein
MADTAALVVALSAQLTKFEKDLQKAGVIAEKSVKDIEGKFEKLNPKISTSFFGNLFANFADKAVGAAITAVEGLIARFKDLQSTASYAAVSMQWLYGLQEAGGKAGASVGAINAAVKALAFSLDEMKRGGDNALKTLLDANPQFMKGVSRDALDVQKTLKIVADIISQAKNQVQAVDMAKHLGLPEETVKLLQKGGEAVEKLTQQAAQGAPDFEKIAAAAKAFDEFITHAINMLKSEAINRLISILEAFQGDTVFKGGPLENLGSDLLNKLKNPPSAAITVNATKRGGSAVDPFATKSAAGDEGAWKRTNDQINKHILLMQGDTEAVGKNAGEQERLRTIALLKAAADKDGIAITAKMTEQMTAQADAAAAAALKLAVAQHQMQELNDASKEFGSALAEAFKGMVLQGKKLDEVLKNLMNRLASKAIDKLFDLAFATPAGGGSSMFTSLLGLGAKAGGGSVNSGVPYIVGEHGPELMVPSQSGMVVPNQALGRTGRALTVAPIYNIDASGADTAAVARLQAALIATNRSLESRALAAVSSHMARGA